MQVAFAEALQGALALPLRQIPVDGGHVVLPSAQLVLEVVDAALGVAEDEHLIGLVPAQKLFKRTHLVLLENFDVDLLDAVDVLLLRLDRDLHGVVREALRELAHVRHERRTEQGGLAPLRTPTQKTAHLRRKAHVEQPVGLVEDHDGHSSKVELAALDVIEQPSRRSDHDRRSAREGTLLRAIGNATVDRDLVRVPVLSDRSELARYLQRELPRGYDDQRLRAFEPRIDLLEDRDRERGGLSRARLRLREEVTALLQSGDGEDLHRRRRHETK